MKPIKFYEVQDHRGDVEWGGVSASEALEWFSRGLDKAIFVSVWDETDPEEPALIVDKIDVTNLVLATMVREGDKWLERARARA